MAFIAYDLSLQLIREVRPAWVELRAADAEEAKQLRRATSSIVRNLAEAGGRHGDDRVRFFRYAHGSAIEVRGTLDAASAWGVDLDAPRATLDRLLALLWRLTH